MSAAGIDTRDAAATPRYRGKDLALLRAWWVAVLVGWLVLSLAGVTVSSMGTYVSEPTVESGILVGQAEPLRSDEYARVTPLMLGVQTAGDADFTTPLTNDPFVTSTVPADAGVWLESAVFGEMGVQYLGRWLPDGPLFAAGFWFPVAVVLLLLPYLLMAWGARFGVAFGLTAVFTLTPVVAWWSLRPFSAILPGVVAAACWVLAMRLSGRWARILGTVGLAVVAGVALARVPWSYAPWSLPLTGAVLALTLIFVIRSKADALRIAIVAVASAVVAAAVTLGLILLNDAAFTALSETTYPGQRRVAGEFVALGRSFGAPFDGIFQTSPAYLVDNPTEWSGSWTIAGVLWLALAVAGWRANGKGWRVRVVLTGLLLAVGFSWFLIDWPVALGEAVPLLNLVPPTRMAAIWGLVVVLAIAPLLGVRLGWVLAGIVAVTSAVVLYLAGRNMAEVLVAELTTSTIVVITVVTTAILLLFAGGKPVWLSLGFAAAIIGSGLIVYSVNPVQKGLAPLRGSEAAAAVLASEPEGSGGLFAVDSPSLSSLLIANGVPALSGEQWAGPSDRWRVLDPQGEYSEQWNRAVSKVSFEWVPGVEQPVITAIAPDDIVITLDPCAPVLDEFAVDRVISSVPLAGTSCLTELDRGVWNGEQFVIYARG
ncbi:MAG: hypothetical protein H6525_00455 [Actinobacteria bacterium]|nr:hypothetical protein [Actinomycetota bacterium]